MYWREYEMLCQNKYVPNLLKIVNTGTDLSSAFIKRHVCNRYCIYNPDSSIILRYKNEAEVKSPETHYRLSLLNEFRCMKDDEISNMCCDSTIKLKYLIFTRKKYNMVKDYQKLYNKELKYPHSLFLIKGFELCNGNNDFFDKLLSEIVKVYEMVDANIVHFHPVIKKHITYLSCIANVYINLYTTNIITPPRFRKFQANFINYYDKFIKNDKSINFDQERTIHYNYQLYNNTPNFSLTIKRFKKHRTLTRFRDLILIAALKKKDDDDLETLLIENLDLVSKLHKCGFSIVSIVSNYLKENSMRPTYKVLSKIMHNQIGYVLREKESDKNNCYMLQYNKNMFMCELSDCSICFEEYHENDNMVLSPCKNIICFKCFERITKCPFCDNRYVKPAKFVKCYSYKYRLV